MRVSLAAAIVAGVAVLLTGIAGPGYRVGLFSLELALEGILWWAAIIGLLGLLLGVGAAYWSVRQQQRKALVLAIGAIVVCVPAIAVSFKWVRRAAALPPIHDVSTDLENPPQFTAVVPLRPEGANPLDRPADAADQQRTGYPNLQPETLSGEPALVFDRALQTAQEMGWEIVSADKSTGIIEATDTTTWFGFTDDVAVRLTPWGSGSRVDVRSVSRVGERDLGTNARRIEQFLGALRQ